MKYSEAKIYLANGEKIYRDSWKDMDKFYVKWGTKLVDIRDFRPIDENEFLSDKENITSDDWEVYEPHYLICYGMSHSNQAFRLVSQKLDHPVIDVLVDSLVTGEFKDEVLFTEKDIDRIVSIAPMQEQHVLNEAILTLQELRDRYEIK